MHQMSINLFKPIVKTDKLHPSFVQLLEAGESHPGRQMMEEIYRDYKDPDGNYLEQFQTAGFDARFFELYLYAVFSRHGFSIDRSNPNPDFILERENQRVAVEATTVNRSTSGPLSGDGKKINEMSFSERLQYESQELAIRFGSPLYSKLQKKYWELDHCKGMPLVLAIQAFHHEEAIFYSDNALTQYLYGLGLV